MVCLMGLGEVDMVVLLEEVETDSFLITMEMILWWKDQEDLLLLLLVMCSRLSAASMDKEGRHHVEAISVQISIISSAFIPRLCPTSNSSHTMRIYTSA